MIRSILAVALIEMKTIQNVAIIGGGPAASTLAILLSRQGKRVAVFALPSTAPIIVGESLVPMIVPMLKDLGVEQEVAGYSKLKPGACFTYNGNEIFEFGFGDNPDDLPSYAYNVPRKELNQTLLNQAKKSGAKIIEHKVVLSRTSQDDSIELDAEAINFVGDFWEKRQPDLIVDASGRVNLIGKLLNIPSQKGPRQDVALFAHVDETELVDPGYVHNDRIDRGWCWRIPLPGRVSFGFVVPADYADAHGDNPEQQYDNLLQQDTVLKQLAPKAKRITPVLKFDNYQSLSERLSGSNWVMLGDSGGFVDPVFSSGMLIAMDSAYQLAEVIAKMQPLSRYEAAIRKHLRAWFEIVGYYYNGRLMTSIKVGQTLTETPSGKMMVPWISKHMSRIFSGAAASHRFSLFLLRILVQYGLRGRNPGFYRIN